mgnify:CR=1 FL=1
MLSFIYYVTYILRCLSSAESSLLSATDFRPTAYPSGYIGYNFPTIANILCAVDVTFFPYDIQTCKYIVLYT